MMENNDGAFLTRTYLLPYINERTMLQENELRKKNGSYQPRSHSSATVVSTVSEEQVVVVMKQIAVGTFEAQSEKEQHSKGASANLQQKD